MLVFFSADGGLVFFSTSKRDDRNTGMLFTRSRHDLPLWKRFKVDLINFGKKRFKTEIFVPFLSNAFPCSFSQMLLNAQDGGGCSSS